MPHAKSRRGLGLLELLLVLAGVAVVAFGAGSYHRAWKLGPFLAYDTEMNALEQQYGPERNSEHGEEWIIRDVFGDQRDGIFVDVGANHHQRDSNTYYLETALGWSGIAIEPQTSFAADYARYRPRTQFIALFVSDESNNEAVLHVPEDNRVASSSQAFAGAGGESTTEMRSRTTTLDDILDRSGLSRIDFLTMDIELAEPAALRGFSIQHFRPRLVCIEAHPAVRQQILDYFAGAGYVAIGKYLRADTINLWFSPLDAAKPPTP